MKHVFSFDLGCHRVLVAADSFQQALTLLCSADYFDGWDEGMSFDWRTAASIEVFRIHYFDDPLCSRDKVPDGLTWDESTKTLSGPASAWAKASNTPEIISDSEF